MEMDNVSRPAGGRASSMYYLAIGMHIWPFVGSSIRYGGGNRTEKVANKGSNKAGYSL